MADQGSQTGASLQPAIFENRQFKTTDACLWLTNINPSNVSK